jgi:hypothetical protein
VWRECARDIESAGPCVRGDARAAAHRQ